MRIVSLNVWGGRVYSKLAEFLEGKKTGVDIFCFQEVLDANSKTGNEAKATKQSYQGTEFEEVQDLYGRLENVLTGFRGFLSASYSEGSEKLAMFVRNGIEADVRTAWAHKQIRVLYGGKPFEVGSIMQYAKISNDNGTCFIANVHGLWQGGGKEDTPERIEQSRNILRIMSSFGERKILCGDFNLDISTESVHMLEQETVNLVKEFKINSTRSALAPSSKGRFADYIFASDKIKINKFNVLNDVVSDHLPLYVDFE
ncbi:MAG: endonuclease/exonuclease/phosphatase family protein [Candidatus Micrarchaeales archaeon]|jgi:endonuclease/exonuclease/phosphatase family metal-dependent hydrolase|uniref:Endonuclease/exonuclease/phosphatase n=1 Tax=Candidatus Micrarchaeum acidiphilum ARMAN-2 TaxID=425595 RepID=C7DIJ7_MICA2|nr:MAG: Endonuclease/exonuclease/phosphatase [Candidatus Micrarchaeum acidiphilum ARMAN-2]MCW6161026.1 endonuclease/exonuclease/phosphatase family protein [Candidatus Micrarchaeales archaeon]